MSATAASPGGLPLADSIAPVSVVISPDDDRIVARLVATPDSIDEDGGTVSGVSAITARLSQPTDSAVTVTVAAAPVSPAVAADYVLSGTTLTVADGSSVSSGVVTVAAVDNTRREADKEIRLTGTADKPGGVLPMAQTATAATLTIINDERRPPIIYRAPEPTPLPTAGGQHSAGVGGHFAR